MEFCGGERMDEHMYEHNMKRKNFNEFCKCNL